jgi:hypothetical protein
MRFFFKKTKKYFYSKHLLINILKNIYKIISIVPGKIRFYVLQRTFLYHYLCTTY